MKGSNEDDFWKLRLPKPSYVSKWFKKTFRKKLNTQRVNGREVVKGLGLTLFYPIKTAISLILMLQIRDYINFLLTFVLPSGEGIINQTIITGLVVVFAVSMLYGLERNKRG